jgi:hypothetical protein
VADLATLKSRIASELHRSDLTTQIANAISDAIQHYQPRRFAFNQVRGTFNTVNGTEFYSDLTDIGEIDCVTLTVNARKVPMSQWSYSEMEAVNTTTNTNGQPWAYSWYAEQIRLYPVPDDAYTVTVSYLRKIAEPATDATENEWTLEAEALIRNAAKKRICREYTRDAEGAMQAEASEGEALRRLIKDSNQLSTGGLDGCW